MSADISLETVYVSVPVVMALQCLGSVVNLRISVSKPLFPSFPRKREPGIR